MKNLLTMFLRSESTAKIQPNSPPTESSSNKLITKGMTLTLPAIMLGTLALAAPADSDEEAAHALWREGITKIEAPGAGCFAATYPSNLWEPVACATLSAFTHPVHRTPGPSETTGNGNDYVLTGGLLKQIVGSFPTVTDVTSEKSVGVAAFGGGGILGSNEYSLQINTNYNSKTAACNGGGSSCTVWQQFIYATDYATKGSGAVFMQYWLINYGASGARCPAGFGKSGSDCYKNSSYVSAPDVAATSLANLKVTAAVVAGGNDSVTFANGTKAYTVSASDKVLDIATVWEESEFNIVGDAGGSEAVFNTGASITVNLAGTFVGNATAGCLANSGSTGETNDLNLKACTASGSSIKFTESLP